MDEYDFISGYGDYADVLEAPRILHELVAIQIVAAALNRLGVSFRNGVVRYFLDLWILLLSGSGSGRNTIMSLAVPVIELASMEDLERPVRWGSAAMFFQHFAENPCGLFVWGEMAEQLKMLNDPKFSTAKEWMTDRFDNSRIPPPHRYRSTGKGTDTPPIQFNAAPRINILATSASEWFYHNIAESDSAGGFIPRWTIIKAESDGRDIAIPRAPDPSLVEPLAVRIAAIGTLTGEADLTAILPAYSQWYLKAKRRFEAQPNRTLAMAYWNRHRGNVLKLAVVFEASQSISLTVSMRAWMRASQLARTIEKSIFEMLPTGMSAAGYDLQKIEEKIKQAGPDGLSQNELTRCFQSMDARDREQKIRTLLDAERIVADSIKTAGRPKLKYVHENFRQGEP